MKKLFPVILALLVLAGSTVLSGARADEAPSAQSAEQSEKEKKAEQRLLPVGQVAPDFTLPLVTGGETTLANLLKFGKAVFVGFWGIEPENGGELMAKLQKLHDKLEGKGLSTIVINPVDEATEVKKFVEAGNLQFLVAIDGKETNRAVTGVYRARNMLPVFYLLDPDGKVLWRSIRLNEETLMPVLEKAGVK
jgi:peroxiredoxin